MIDWNGNGFDALDIALNDLVFNEPERQRQRQREEDEERARKRREEEEKKRGSR